MTSWRTAWRLMRKDHAGRLSRVGRGYDRNKRAMFRAPCRTRSRSQDGFGSTWRLIPGVAPYNIVELDRPEASRTEASARSHPGSARDQTRDATPFDHSIRKRSIANPEVRSTGDAGFTRPGGSQEGLRSAERFRHSAGLVLIDVAWYYIECYDSILVNSRALTLASWYRTLRRTRSAE
jgi:hypothetical protein